LTFRQSVLCQERSNGDNERGIAHLKDDTSRSTSSFGNVDSIRILRVGMDGEDLGGQGDRVSILVGGFGLSALLFGDRIPCHQVSADGLLLLHRVLMSLTRSGSSCRRLIATCLCIGICVCSLLTQAGYFWIGALSRRVRLSIRSFDRALLLHRESSHRCSQGRMLFCCTLLWSTPPSASVCSVIFPRILPTIDLLLCSLQIDAVVLRPPVQFCSPSCFLGPEPSSKLITYNTT
jgi:hypothetical protein